MVMRLDKLKRTIRKSGKFLYILAIIRFLSLSQSQNFLPATTDRNVEESTATTRSLLHDIPHPAMTCQNSSSSSATGDQKQPQPRCCVAWEISIDEWRTHHPDWHVVPSPSQQQDMLCLAKYDEPKATFFRELYRLQWTEENDGTNATNIYQRTELPPLRRNCSNLVQNFQVGSGMGASIGAVLSGLYTAHSQHRPYQLNKHWHGFPWLYAPLDNSSWAYCPNTDLSCYVLPLGNCINTFGESEGKITRARLYSSTMWLREYLLRFSQATLWKIHNETTKVLGRNTKNHTNSNDDEDCTVIHVRRGDSGLPQQPFRRYAPLSEYIEAGNITPKDLVLILSDDLSTIYEAETFYPDYRWTWLERPRVNLTFGGFDGHIPSGDPAQEFVNIFAESTAAAKCHTLVHGKSGFISMVQATRESLGLPPAKEITINTGISKKRGPLLCR